MNAVQRVLNRNLRIVLDAAKESYEADDIELGEAIAVLEYNLAEDERMENIIDALGLRHPLEAQA